jgi:enamine deaminase RidA (YjgF/YER057c/UK114 family)
MTATIISPDDLFQSPAFSHGVSKAGRLLYVAGQLPLDAEGNCVGVGDIAAQVDRVWFQIERVLAEAGGSLADLVKITSYIVDPEHVRPVVDSRLTRFEPGRVPASALLIVAGLARPEFLVEIEGVAILD